MVVCLSVGWLVDWFALTLPCMLVLLPFLWSLGPLILCRDARSQSHLFEAASQQLEENLDASQALVR